ASHRVWLHGEEISLTTQEFELLRVLARSAGTILSREELFKRVRGIEYDGLDRSIDGRISKLRKKLGDDALAPNRIRTIGGKGSLLVPAAWWPAMAPFAPRRHGRLLLRTYVVIVGGLIVTAALFDYGFGRLQEALLPPAPTNAWVDGNLALIE